MSENLLNKAACKRLALRWARDHRTGWDAERVSAKFLDALEYHVRNKITNSVSRHRTVGKTIIDLH